MGTLANQFLLSAWYTLSPESFSLFSVQQSSDFFWRENLNWETACNAFSSNLTFMWSQRWNWYHYKANPVLQRNKDYGSGTYRETEAIERCAHFVPNSCPVSRGWFVLCFLPLGYAGFSHVPFAEARSFELLQVGFPFLQTSASTATMETKFSMSLFPLNQFRCFAHSRDSINLWQHVYLLAIYASPSNPAIFSSMFAHKGHY